MKPAEKMSDAAMQVELDWLQKNAGRFACGSAMMERAGEILIEQMLRRFARAKVAAIPVSSR